MMFSQDVRNVVWDLICINIIVCNVLFAVHCITSIYPHVTRAWRRAKLFVLRKYNHAKHFVYWLCRLRYDMADVVEKHNELDLRVHDVQNDVRDIIKTNEMLQEHVSEVERKLRIEIQTLKLQQRLDQAAMDAILRRASLRSAK